VWLKDDKYVSFARFRRYPRDSSQDIVSSEA